MRTPVLRGYLQDILEGRRIDESRVSVVLRESGFRKEDVPRIIGLARKIRDNEVLSRLDQVALGVLEDHSYNVTPHSRR
jgi:hypothetical protein